MRSLTPARLRGRPRRLLLAAALPTALAVTALPAAADASVLTVFPGATTEYEYDGDGGQNNTLIVSEQADGSRVFTDSVPLRIDEREGASSSIPTRSAAAGRPRR